MKKKYRNLIKNYKTYVMQTYPAPEIALIRGKGSYVWDMNDRKYLDFTSGISVCNLGHCHPAVSKAIRKQCRKLVHVSNLFINENQTKLAEMLIHRTFEGTAFFCNSGAEANEGLIKLARKWGNPKGKFKIITMEHSFHGRTLATLAATGRSKYRKGFEPDTEGFICVPFNDLAAIEKAVNENDNKVAAVMLEPVQGEGGIIQADPGYLKNLRKFCDRNEILLLFDEVQCGMGRTGKFSGFQNYDVLPDAMSLAKALGNGYPIGALIAGKNTSNVLTAGTHASTFGGTPLACAAAIAVLETFDNEKILGNCNRMSKYAFKVLGRLKDKYPVIDDVRGLGLMIGIAFKEKSSDVSKKAKELGLLTVTAGENVIRFYPPLTVTKKEIDEAVEILDKAIKASV